MAQHGQVLRLRTRRSDGKAKRAYRYRVDGRWSKRRQVGGFVTCRRLARLLECFRYMTVPYCLAPDHGYDRSAFSDGPSAGRGIGA